jgi:prephenate dehydrogenase
MEIDSLAIIGVGLIGASVGLAARSRGAARRITGYDAIDDHTTVARIQGAIDRAAGSLAEAVSDADLIIVCTPVDRIAEHVIAAAAQARPDAVITDVGSTKGNIVRDVEQAEIPNFLGSHPMAGSERKGPLAATGDLFLNRVTILTPTDRTQPAVRQVVEQFWTQLGCRTAELSPIEHDRTVAAISHVPHILAAALAGATDPALLPFAAGGFRDTTRVAGAGPGIWVPIFRDNRAAVLAALARTTDSLARFRALLEADDGPGLAAWLADAQRVRHALGR